MYVHVHACLDRVSIYLQYNLCVQVHRVYICVCVCACMYIYAYTCMTADGVSMYIHPVRPTYIMRRYAHLWMICMYVCMYIRVYVWSLPGLCEAPLTRQQAHPIYGWYVCMYVYTYVCMDVCMSKMINTWLMRSSPDKAAGPPHLWMICMYVYTYVCMYVCMYTRMYVCMYVQDD
jgi:hypothetical protein